jgi:hypothetical protein
MRRTTDFHRSQLRQKEQEVAELLRWGPHSQRGSAQQWPEVAGPCERSTHSAVHSS